MKNARRRAVLIALSAAASSRVFAADRTVRGSGHVVTERRAVGGFDRIAIAGAFEVELRQGTQEGVELSGDDNLLALVETRIEGAPGTASLQIGPKKDTQLQPTQPIRLRIDMMRLSGLSLAGSAHIAGRGLHAKRLGVSIGGTGSVELPGLEAERLAVDIGGSGQASADGRVVELAVEIGGSGRCALSRLVADDARISIAGSGNAEVNVSRQLRVSIAGSGQVRHTGAAVPSVSIVGSGSVQRG